MCSAWLVPRSRIFFNGHSFVYTLLDSLTFVLNTEICN